MLHGCALTTTVIVNIIIYINILQLLSYLFTLYWLKYSLESILYFINVLMLTIVTTCIKTIDCFSR